MFGPKQSLYTWARLKLRLGAPHMSIADWYMKGVARVLRSQPLTPPAASAIKFSPPPCAPPHSGEQSLQICPHFPPPALPPPLCGL